MLEIAWNAKKTWNGRTDGRGALQYLPSRAFGAAGDKNIIEAWAHNIHKPESILPEDIHFYSDYPLSYSYRVKSTALI